MFAAGVCSPWAGQKTASEKRPGNFSKVRVQTKRETPRHLAAVRFLKQSSSESFSNVNIQNSAFVISSRIGDKTSLLCEVKISFIHRSPFHVLHSKSNLFCGLSMAEALIITLSPHVQYFLLQEKIFALIIFNFNCLAQRQDFPDLNHLIRS